MVIDFLSLYTSSQATPPGSKARKELSSVDEFFDVAPITRSKLPKKVIEPYMGMQPLYIYMCSLIPNLLTSHTHHLTLLTYHYKRTRFT